MIGEKIIGGERITGSEALELLKSNDLHRLGFLANSVRFRKHPEPMVTYVIDRNINYTDVCVSACKFCAFFKSPEEADGSVLSLDELRQKIEETKELGGTQILLQGGLHPDLPFSFYEEMISFMKGLDIHIHGFSPPEIWHFSELSGLPIAEVIARLRKAGLDSIPGGGAEILTEHCREQTSPRKCGAQQWLDAMEEAHNQGMRTTATMMFGHVESLEDRIEHLQRVRDLQDRTAGFTAFIPWPFQPDNTVLEHLPKTSAFSYLKMLAVSRIFLDNVDNIQASWVTQGPKVAQLSLFFGANDFGSTMIEENVVAAAGVSFRLSENEIQTLVEGAGFRPRQRLMDYRLV